MTQPPFPRSQAFLAAALMIHTIGQPALLAYLLCRWDSRREPAGAAPVFPARRTSAGSVTARRLFTGPRRLHLQIEYRSVEKGGRSAPR